MLNRAPVGWYLIAVTFFGCSTAAASPAEPFGNVTDGRVRGELSGDNWLVKGGGFYQDQFSPLTSVNSKNVSKLGFAWAAELPDPMGLTAEPIVVDGVIYVSGPRSLVYAIDATSGRIVWKFDPHVRLDFGTNGSEAARVNRGVAVWAGKVYVGTGDCRLLAINASNGTQSWESKVCDPAKTGITGAPRVGRGKVFIGHAAEGHIRGSVAAFDAATGKEVWRFWTVPADPSKGFEDATIAMAAETWSGKEWWEDAGGGVWDAITLDPTSGLLLFGTSKTPNRNSRDERLFTGCIVAVNADTGAYAWHFRTSTSQRQTENFHIALTDIAINGERHHVALTAARNGTFYVIDAKSGKLLGSAPLVEQGDPNGLVATSGKEIEYPGLLIGGAEDCAPKRCFGVRNWWPMSYDPVTHLAYVPIMDLRRGRVGSHEIPMVGRLLAWDPVHRRVRWSIEHQIMVNGGVLSTAGNLVFQGQGTGEFAAYAADSGRKLWSVDTGSAIDAVPITYRVGSEQFVLVPVGWGSMYRLWAPSTNSATATSKYGPSRLLAFKIGGEPFPVPRVDIPLVPRPPAQIYSAEAVSRGQQIAGMYGCYGCHSINFDGSGRWAVNGGIPDLRYMPPEAHREWYAIVLAGSHRSAGMMPYGAGVPSSDSMPPMTAQQADDIHAFVIDRQWAAYSNQQNAQTSH